MKGAGLQRGNSRPRTGSLHYSVARQAIKAASGALRPLGIVNASRGRPDFSFHLILTVYRALRENVLFGSSYSPKYRRAFGRDRRREQQWGRGLAYSRCRARCSFLLAFTCAINFISFPCNASPWEIAVSAFADQHEHSASRMSSRRKTHICYCIYAGRVPSL